MIDIFAIRGLGGNRGDDITDPLITTLGVALARGQVEVDKSAPIKNVQLTSKFRTDVTTGQVIEVIDALQGAAWRGKITSVEHGRDGVALITRLRVEKVV